MFETAFFALFGAVYEHFSFGVFSNYMIYAFLIPLSLGVFVYGGMAFKGYQPETVFLNLWNSAIITLTIGCIYQGVLEIYGTTNRLILVYPCAGGILIAAAVISLFLRKKQPVSVS